MLSIQNTFCAVQISMALFFSSNGMSNSDRTPLRIAMVTSSSCALVRTKSCCFNQDPRKEDNALLERIESPRGSRSGSSSPRINRRVRASSITASGVSEQPSMPLVVSGTK